MESVTEHYLSVRKTGRVCTIGKTGKETTEAWLVIHGYAQLATDFIKDFYCLIQEPHRIVIAPEGLNHFYAKGFGGNPVASWMTSEMREYEITDYIAYLNTVCETLVPENCKLILLGFSQGVATASRWLQQSPIPVSTFIVYSGELARELTQEPVENLFPDTSVIYVTGTKDPLIRPDKQQSINELMGRLGASTITFDGGHEIQTTVIDRLKKQV